MHMMKEFLKAFEEALVCYDEVLSDDIDAFCMEPMMMILKASCTMTEPMLAGFMIDPNDSYCGHLIEHFHMKHGHGVLNPTKFEEPLHGDGGPLAYESLVCQWGIKTLEDGLHPSF